MQEIIQFTSRHPVLGITWIGLLAAVLFTIFKDLTSKVKVITCEEVTRLINKEDAIVVDLCPRNDFLKGHIAGSINLLPTEIKNNNFGELGKHKTKPIIVVNNNGMHTHMVANALVKASFKRIYILKNGIAGWNDKNLPLVRSK